MCCIRALKSSSERAHTLQDGTHALQGSGHVRVSRYIQNIQVLILIKKSKFDQLRRNLRLEAKKPYNFDRNPKRGALSKKEQASTTEN